MSSRCRPALAGDEHGQAEEPLRLGALDAARSSCRAMGISNSGCARPIRAASRSRMWRRTGIRKGTAQIRSIVLPCWSVEACAGAIRCWRSRWRSLSVQRSATGASAQNAAAVGGDAGVIARLQGARRNVRLSASAVIRSRLSAARAWIAHAGTRRCTFMTEKHNMPAPDAETRKLLLDYLDPGLSGEAPRRPAAGSARSRRRIERTASRITRAAASGRLAHSDPGGSGCRPGQTRARESERFRSRAGRRRGWRTAR